jgi:hypothetical protein
MLSDAQASGLNPVLLGIETSSGGDEYVIELDVSLGDD